MNTHKKTSLELMNDIYSIAYWMTGSETDSRELLNRTYQHVNPETPESDLFKAFRACYFDSIDQKNINISDRTSLFMAREEETLRHRFADIKLSVLLSEMPGIKHRDISKITGKPVETIRMWLSLGRKSLVNAARLIPPIELRLPVSGVML
jgi:hypothetical protein